MRVFLNALWSLSGFIITTAIMFAAVRIYISYLGLASYGVFTLAMSVLGIAGVFNLGLGDATTKFVAQYHSQDRPDRVTMVVAATAIIYLCIGVAGTTLLVLSAPLIAHHILRLEGLHLVEATQSLAIVGYGFFPLIAQTVFLGYFDGLQRYRVSQTILIARTVIGFAAGTSAVMLGGGVVSLLVAIVFVYWLSVAVVAVLACRELVTVPYPDWRLREQFREVLGYGLFTGLTSLGTTALGQLDKVLVGSLISLEAVSIYGVAQGAASKLLAFANATSRVLMPFFSARSGDDSSLSRPFYKAWRTSVVTCTGIATVFFAASPWLVDIWLGPETGTRVLIPLLLFVVVYAVHCVNVVPYHFLLGRGYAAQVAWHTLGGGLLTLLGIAILGPSYGLLGAIVSSAFYVGAGVKVTRFALSTLGQVDKSARLRTGLPSALAGHLLAVVSAFLVGDYISPEREQLWLGLVLAIVVSSTVILTMVAIEWKRESSWFATLRPLVTSVLRRR